MAGRCENCGPGCSTGTMGELGLLLEKCTVGQLRDALNASDGDSVCLGGRCLPGDKNVELKALDISYDATTEVFKCPPYTHGEEVLCCPEAALKHKTKPKLGLERFLTLWILLTVAAGIGLGQIPGIHDVLDALKVGNTNILTAVGMILMLLPPFASVKYNEFIPSVRRIPKRMAWGSIVVNWLIGPFMMLFLGMITLFEHQDLLQGVVFIGAARCIAMVLVWTALADGDTFLCVSLVLLNSLITVVTYAPVVTLLCIVASAVGVNLTGNVSFQLVVLNVAIYLGIPLCIGLAMWYVGHRHECYWTKFIPRFAPVGLLSLLWTILVMFTEMSQPLLSGDVQAVDILWVVVPLLLYFSLMFAVSWVAARWLLRVPFDQNVTFSFTAASNNFELALAACTGIFGTSSKQAVATVIGPLIEIPVMLGLVTLSGYLRYEPPQDYSDEEESDDDSGEDESE